MNIVAIDPSLLSTGMTVNGKQFSIASESIALNKKLQYTKWFEDCSGYCDIHVISHAYHQETNYCLSELSKLEIFQKNSNLILKIVDNYCLPQYNTLCLIEGYSYASASGPLIDLVTFGTILRQLLLTRAKTYLIILAPTSVKRLAASLTYEPIKKGNKVVYRNNEGIAGGNFNKHEIYKTLIESKDIRSKWIEFLKDRKEILEFKSIPKPIEDINDSVAMYYIADKIYKDNLDLIKTIEILRDY